MSTERTWIYYATRQGNELVEQEIRKAQLTRQEAVRLKVLMDRVCDGATRSGDVDNLGDGVLEVRLRGDKRIFRLLYATQDGGMVLLALHFFSKKTQRTPPQAIKAAVRRLADWLDRK